MASPRGVSACLVQTAAGVNASDDVTDPANASASVSLGTNGTYSATGAAGGNWIEPTSCSGSNYEVQLVISGDSPDSGPSPIGAGNWYDLGTTRTWTWDQTVVGTKSCTYTATIRQITDVTNTGTISGSVSANVDPPE